MAAIVFWASVALLFFTYLGYPLLIAALASLRREKGTPPPERWPPVSVIVVAFDEAARIAARIANLLASDYPALEVLVVSDGSTDDTARIAENAGARVIAQPVRSGKAAGLNAGVAAATGDIIVFADARQTFAPGTIRTLVAQLADARFGAVTGELEIAATAGGIGSGVDVYWRLEKFLRSREARLDSCIGCTGAVYAIRRALFTPLPSDTILDDVIIPMRIAAAGHRIGYRADATAFDPQPLDPANEQRRKRRTLAGNFQMLFRHPRWLLPWRLWPQLIAHKYLRLAGPPLLAAALAANIALAATPLYLALLCAHLAFYALALAGLAIPSRARLLTIPAAFLFLNVNVVRAFWHWLTTRDAGRWA